MSSHNGRKTDPHQIDGRAVVVTGASGGVGRAIVRKLAGRGCKIGLLARGSDALEAARREVEELGGTGLAIATDVSNSEQIEAAAEAVEQAFGPIDVWINDAMVSMYAPFWNISAKEFEHITAVTYLGQVYGTMTALKRMRPRDRGTIVQVGSALAKRSIPLQSAYCGAKHAIAGFTESLRCELIHDKSSVKVTMVDLPGVNTTQFSWTKNRMPHKPRPTGPIFQPEVAADGIIFAAEHPWRKKVIVGFPAWEAIVGEKFVAGALDHYLARAAWDGSQLPQPADPNHADNFWKPLPGDHGSHGPFDSIAKSHSGQLWATEHKKGLWAAVVGIGVGAAVAAVEMRRNHGRAWN
ncbi:MAG TPA: SDR family oxidoreductase [Tepidisphaeraceae bacterium]|nr:SDR family oxidoreductase [Tepidisphaeraceae bacterium]